MPTTSFFATTLRQLLITGTRTAFKRHSEATRFSTKALQPLMTPLPRFSPWKTLVVPFSELDLSSTLKCGQSFRWQRTEKDGQGGNLKHPIWSCAVGGRVFLLQQVDDGIRYRSLRPSGTTSSESSASSSLAEKAINQPIEDDEEYLKDYFQLQVPLTKLYSEWSDKDAHFRKKAPFYPGIRILRQDPVENLICFICSSNNNISRISQMALKLSQEYGRVITIPTEERVGDLACIPDTFYTFPDLTSLAQHGVESRLRELGFGYRAKYIAKSAEMIQKMDNGLDWLYGLRFVSHEEAREALTSLQGVGPKVADCVCLMSLDKNEAIPVDTHVWQIAIRDYRFRTGGNKIPKSMTPAIYKAVGDLFNNLFGKYSGWAHSVLFAADLRSMQGRENEGNEGSSTTTSTIATTTTHTTVSVKREKTSKLKSKVQSIERIVEQQQFLEENGGKKRRSTRIVAAKVEIKSEEATVTMLSRPRRAAATAYKRQKKSDGISSKYFND